ncbi:transposase-like protein [Bacillus sp. RC251]|uniref:Transposase n=3 Tax=Bacillus cereus group TaxID=86661 RepID=A0A0G8EU23_BACCE|nr:hypothetical protein B4077_5988 [Bacillus cereus]KMP91447.1 transposase [Bacillus wiedmannii]TCW42310.1 transposase-like protein [Bacillus thuringiensis]KMP75102.1 transposase [Bacillus cereus]KXY27850.1 transposase [Bacillus cereus]
MTTRVHYPEETKWKVIEMKKDGYSNRTIMEKLGIKNVSQIKTWMKWYRTDQTYRFQQPVGKQYSYGKGPKELSELEQLRLENKHLKTKLLVWGKYLEIERG